MTDDAAISAEKRLDDVVDVELSQVGVLLTRSDEQDRLARLVAHRKRRAHLYKSDSTIKRHHEFHITCSVSHCAFFEYTVHGRIRMY